MASLIRRLASALLDTKAPMAMTAPIQDAPRRLLDVKESSTSLLPRGAYHPSTYVFFSPDGGKTEIPLDGDRWATLAFISYWYVATRWRAQKIAEPPLMVIEEDQENGSEEWLPDHELVDILDEPSPDYDMGELLQLTSGYLDNSGEAIWVMDRDRVGRVSRITPFNRREFEVRSSDERMFAKFDVQTRDGRETFDAEDVCYFRDGHGASTNTETWARGRSRLDAALSMLRLGAKATKTIHDLLDNSIWPSLVVQPDPSWNPTPEQYEEYKQDLADYGQSGNKGRPFVALGGGSVTAVAARIRDLVPEEVLNRVESVVSAVSGVPAIVLQFQVGMENSPWSQMEQARRMAYDDTIIPAWRKFEKVLTRQMLRPIDDDKTHFIRFDSSQVASLQGDQQVAVSIAVMMGRAASLNERRTQMGLEPVADPKADEIPELTTPDLASLLAGGGGANTDDSEEEDDDAEDDPEDADPEDGPAKKAAERRALQRKFRAPALVLALREEAQTVWKISVAQLLHKDATHIADLVENLLTEENTKSIEAKARGKSRVMTAVVGYLKEDGRKAWAKATTPLLVRAAERSTAVVAADLNVGFNVLHPQIISFAQRKSGTLIKAVSETTRSLVSDIIQGGLDEGASVKSIAQLIRDAAGFSSSRAQLIARTETTTAFNGAPTETLSALGASTGRRFTKTWSGALDDRERDEHLALEGETVEISENFSNGLAYPSDPNCRCTLLFNEVEE